MPTGYNATFVQVFPDGSRVVHRAGLPAEYRPAPAPQEGNSLEEAVLKGARDRLRAWADLEAASVYMGKKVREETMQDLPIGARVSVRNDALPAQFWGATGQIRGVIPASYCVSFDNKDLPFRWVHKASVSLVESAKPKEATMKKLRKGDRVKVTGPDVLGSADCAGWAGTMKTDVCSDGSCVVHADGRGDRYFFVSSLEPETKSAKFKVGDKVRPAGTGEVFEVVDHLPDGRGETPFAGDHYRCRDPQSGATYLYKEEDIEPAEELKVGDAVEVRDYSRSWDGMRGVIVEPTEGSNYPAGCGSWHVKFEGDGLTMVWLGRYLKKVAREGQPLKAEDLPLERVEEPKFKVGDRVRVRKGAYAAELGWDHVEGVVTDKKSVYDPENVYVKFGDVGPRKNEEIHFPPDNLELVQAVFKPGDRVRYTLGSYEGTVQRVEGYRASVRWDSGGTYPVSLSNLQHAPLPPEKVECGLKELPKYKQGDRVVLQGTHRYAGRKAVVKCPWTPEPPPKEPHWVVIFPSGAEQVATEAQMVHERYTKPQEPPVPSAPGTSATPRLDRLGYKAGEKVRVKLAGSWLGFVAEVAPEGKQLDPSMYPDRVYLKCTRPNPNGGEWVHFHVSEVERVPAEEPKKVPVEDPAKEKTAEGLREAEGGLRVRWETLKDGLQRLNTTGPPPEKKRELIKDLCELRGFLMATMTEEGRVSAMLVLGRAVEYVENH